VASLLTEQVDEGLADFVRRAAEAAARAVIVSDDALDDRIRTRAGVAALSRTADALGVRPRVVVVVRDQVGLLNERYCERVVNLEIGRDFESFVGTALGGEALDYSRAFDVLIGSSAVSALFVPYGALRAGAEGPALLAAVGLELDGPLPPAAPAQTGNDLSLPGPMRVAASRWLFKRLVRRGLVQRLPEDERFQLRAQLAARAREAGWDSRPYWGWTPTLRAQAIGALAGGNDVFATAVWDRPWSEPWADGEPTDLDVVGADPATVADILLTVDRLVTDLTA
jgi:hypothetical protein